MDNNLKWIRRTHPARGTVWTATVTVGRRPVALRVDGRQAKREGWRTDVAGMFGAIYESIDGGKGAANFAAAKAVAEQYVARLMAEHAKAMHAEEA